MLKTLSEDVQLTTANASFQMKTSPLFPNLGILSLAHNRLTRVPQHLHCIKHLNSLNLSHNTITELPEEMGLINTDYITQIKLDGIQPSNVPEHLLKASSRKLIKYLRAR